jgi:hypothetical protein
VRIEQVQVALKVAACESLEVADEVPVDVVGMVLVFNEGPVCEDVAYADAAKLSDEDGEVLNKRSAPGGVPRGGANAVSCHK